MLICKECGKIFDAPKTYEECMGEFWGFPAYETFSICPFCDSEDFEEYREGDDDYEDQE